MGCFHEETSLVTQQSSSFKGPNAGVLRLQKHKQTLCKHPLKRSWEQRPTPSPAPSVSRIWMGKCPSNSPFCGPFAKIVFLRSETRETLMNILTYIFNDYLSIYHIRTHALPAASTICLILFESCMLHVPTVTSCVFSLLPSNRWRFADYIFPFSRI